MRLGRPHRQLSVLIFVAAAAHLDGSVLADRKSLYDDHVVPADRHAGRPEELRALPAFMEHTAAHSSSTSAVKNSSGLIERWCEALVVFDFDKAGPDQGCGSCAPSCMGGDLAQIKTAVWYPGAGEVDCLNLCRQDAKCMGVTVDKDANTCSLLSEVPATTYCPKADGSVSCKRSESGGCANQACLIKASNTEDAAMVDIGLGVCKSAGRDRLPVLSTVATRVSAQGVELLNSSVLGDTAVTTAEACADKCMANLRCRAMTFGRLGCSSDCSLSSLSSVVCQLYSGSPAAYAEWGWFQDNPLTENLTACGSGAACTTIIQNDTKCMTKSFRTDNAPVFRTTGLCAKANESAYTNPAEEPLIRKEEQLIGGMTAEACRSQCTNDPNCKGYAIAISANETTQGTSVCKQYGEGVTTGRTELLQAHCNTVDENGTETRRCPTDCVCTTNADDRMRECTGLDREECIDTCNPCLDAYHAECFAVGLG